MVTNTRHSNTIFGDRKPYIPVALPPQPAIDMTQLYKPLDKAMITLSRLNTLIQRQVNNETPLEISFLIYMYVRKEALMTSQIEGTKSSFSDLLLFENAGNPSVSVDDVEEVCNYIAAMNHGLDRMKAGFPFCTRLIRDMHKILLCGGRGADKNPGEFRRVQNWIGSCSPSTAEYIPPPPEMVESLMSDLEKFANDEDQKLPALIKAALIHVQFETIHPFLDGNGRLGRLLVTLLLCADEVMTHPSLYLSLYFKENCRLYYDKLQDVRFKGKWGCWCDFFLNGVTTTAKRAADDVEKIIDLLEHDRMRISKIGKASKTIFKIHDYLLKKPYLSITKVATELNISVPATINAVQKLVDIGMLKEITGKSRNRIFKYEEYLDILVVGTEPIKKD